MDDVTPWWTLPGFWLPTEEIYTAHVQANTIEVARDIALMEAQQIWEAAGQTGPAQIRFCGVYPGQHYRSDYNRYLDPNQVD